MISTYLTAICIAIFGIILKYLGLDYNILTLALTLIFTVFITAVYGYSVEKVAYKPLRGAARLSLLISAIGMSLILQNYVQISQGADNKTVPNLMNGIIKFSFNNSSNSADFVQISQVQLMIIIVSFVTMLILYNIVNKTKLGRMMRATAEDRVMANILGINSDRTISYVFILGAIAAAIAGFLVSINYGSFDFHMGFITGIKAFTAAVLGGIGSLPGAMIGGLILGLAESLFSGFVNTDYKDVFAFALLIVILIFKPTGLLGKPEVEKV
tara:strand:+ start:5 stop:814 length:810 start_codon:yes stop_codon:yes gene_type:complete